MTTALNACQFCHSMTFPAHIAWETDIKYLQTDAMNSMYMYMAF